MIHLITGIPGSGKSIAAEYLRKHLPAPALELSTDKVREWLFSTPAWGDFPPEELSAVYRIIPRIVRFAAQAERRGHYIVHGTYRSHAQRTLVAAAASEANQSFRMLWIRVPVDIAAARADQRNRETGKGHHAASVRETAGQYEEPRHSVPIDNSGSIADMRRQLDVYIARVSARRKGRSRK